MQSIHTINSRDNVILETSRDHFGLTGVRMKCEIQRLHREVVAILASKKIKYADLRTALVPNIKKQEAALIFDSRETGSPLYGRDIFNKLLPLLNPQTNQSILVGDLLGDDQKLIFEILRESMILARSFAFNHATLLYCVYLNNLSDAALKGLHEQLASYRAYLGYIPTTFISRAKIYISMSVAGFLIKKGKNLIIGHEDDRPNTEDVNITPYDLEQFGYKVSSLQSNYFSIFLSYKIELPTLKGYESDIEIALNSISDDAQPFGDFSILLDDRKHEHLIKNKLGKFKMAGLATADRIQIESIIHSKILSNYIYNLWYREEHDVMMFNLMLEIGRQGEYPTRMMASIEYMPESKTLRVITLY